MPFLRFVDTDEDEDDYDIAYAYSENIGTATESETDKTYVVCSIESTNDSTTIKTVQNPYYGSEL